MKRLSDTEIYTHTDRPILWLSLNEGLKESITILAQEILTLRARLTKLESDASPLSYYQPDLKCTCIGEYTGLPHTLSCPYWGQR